MLRLLKLTFCVGGVCFAQSAKPLRFEVASIRPSSAEAGTASGIGTRQGTLTAENVTLLRCIIGAYGTVPTQIVGGPPWIHSVRFDILAKAEEPTDDDALLMRMLQELLAERFKLVVHRESRSIPVFVLEATRNGPKIKNSEGESLTKTRSSNAGVSMDIANTDMDAFARVLSRELDRPVVNRTGLQGSYSFTLEWSSENRSRAKDAPDAGSLFTAIQEQLGLRLRSERAPVEVLVVDSAERPSEN